MTKPYRCTYCGARISAGAASCAYCGTVAREEPTTVVGAGPVPIDFRKLDEHPDYPHMLALTPSRSPFLARVLKRVVFYAVFCAIAASMAWRSREGSLPHMVPLAFVLLGLVLFAGGVWELGRGLLVPIRGVGAGVVDARVGTEEPAGRRFVKLALRGGAERKWYAPRGKDWAPGDLGVAFLLGDELLEFRRLPDATPGWT